MQHHKFRPPYNRPSQGSQGSQDLDNADKTPLETLAGAGRREEEQRKEEANLHPMHHLRTLSTPKPPNLLLMKTSTKWYHGLKKQSYPP